MTVPKAIGVVRRETEAEMNFEQSKVARISNYAEGLDDFPTPPWAVRALLKYAIQPSHRIRGSVIDPCVGRGHIANTLKENRGFTSVHGADIVDYGWPGTQVVGVNDLAYSHHYTITNPPYKMAGEFFQTIKKSSSKGFALLVKESWIQ